MWSAMEKFNGFEKIKKHCQKNIRLKAIRIAKSSCRCIRNMARIMFAMLDAEFACIIYDGETGEFIAARDPIGIRPLYYGYDKITPLCLPVNRKI